MIMAQGTHPINTLNEEFNDEYVDINFRVNDEQPDMDRELLNELDPENERTSSQSSPTPSDVSMTRDGVDSTNDCNDRIKLLHISKHFQRISPMCARRSTVRNGSQTNFFLRNTSLFIVD